MLEDKKTKVKITFFIILVGISSMFVAIVTDHWAVLSARLERLNSTCDTAHLGLWRLCKKSIFIAEEDHQGTACGPLSLPGGKGFPVCPPSRPHLIPSHPISSHPSHLFPSHPISSHLQGSLNPPPRGQRARVGSEVRVQRWVQRAIVGWVQRSECGGGFRGL